MQSIAVIMAYLTRWTQCLDHQNVLNFGKYIILYMHMATKSVPVFFGRFHGDCTIQIWIWYHWQYKLEIQHWNIGRVGLQLTSINRMWSVSNIQRLNRLSRICYFFKSINIMSGDWKNLKSRLKSFLNSELFEVIRWRTASSKYLKQALHVFLLMASLLFIHLIGRGIKMESVIKSSCTQHHVNQWHILKHSLWHLPCLLLYEICLKVLFVVVWVAVKDNLHS